MNDAIKDAWRTYQREVIPRNAPAVQHEECRRAFYAGAFALFSLVMDASADPKSEAEGAAVLDQLSQELQAYAAAMDRLARKGRG